jgi:hypothetical protein
MKGKRLTNCLVVEAADGYRAVIALPELDPTFTDNGQCSPFYGTANLSVKKKSHTGSSFPTKKDGPLGQAGDDAKDRGRAVSQVNPSES